MVVALREYWPGVPTGERETLERISCALKLIGLESVKVPVSFDDNEVISRIDPLFVLDLHFASPAISTAFSVGALWNPLDYYTLHGDGTALSSQLGHDLFVAANPAVATEWLKVLLPEYSRGILPFNHTVQSSSVCAPNDYVSGNIFYAGIGWGRSKSTGQRHQALFQLLDSSEKLELYGPTRLADGTRPWRNFNSYKGEIPFDGVSMFERINKSGFGLALSSTSHRASGILSNRFFETIAAGSIPIVESDIQAPFPIEGCIEIPTDYSEKQTAEFILEETLRLFGNPEERVHRVGALQSKLLSGFTLDQQLAQIANKVNELRAITVVNRDEELLTLGDILKPLKGLKSGGLDSLEYNPLTLSLQLHQNLARMSWKDEDWLAFSDDETYLTDLRWQMQSLDLEQFDVLHTLAYSVSGDSARQVEHPFDIGHRAPSSIVVRVSLIKEWIQVGAGCASVGALLRSASADLESQKPVLRHSVIRKPVINLSKAQGETIGGLSSGLDVLVLNRLAKGPHALISQLAAVNRQIQGGESESGTLPKHGLLAALAREIREVPFAALVGQTIKLATKSLFRRQPNKSNKRRS